MTKQIFIHKDESNERLFDLADQMDLFKRQLELVIDKGCELKKQFFNELRKIHKEGDLKYVNHDEKVMSIELNEHEDCNCPACIITKIVGGDND